jgi:hypothetical protein
LKKDQLRYYTFEKQIIRSLSVGYHKFKTSLGVLMACLIVYLVMFQKKMKLSVEFWIYFKIAFVQIMGGQIQGLNDLTPIVLFPFWDET